MFYLTLVLAQAVQAQPEYVSVDDDSTRVVPPPTMVVAKGGNGTVSGTVRLDSGDPVMTNLGIVALDINLGFFRRASTQVNFADGTYSISVPPGDYVFATDASSGTFGVNAFHDGTPCLGGTFNVACDAASATPVTVGPGAMVTLDFDLVEGGRIAGVLREATTGFPARFPNIHWFDSEGVLVLNDTPVIRTSNISYIADNMPPGTYFVVIDMPGFVPILLPDMPCPDIACDVTQGDPVAIQPGVQIDNVDLMLDVDASQGGAIAGTIDDRGASPNSGQVVVETPAMGSVGLASAFTFADQTANNYVVAGLPPGAVNVRTRSYNAVDELFDNFPCDPGCDTGLGTPVSITAGAITMGVDFILGNATAPALAANPDPGDRFGDAIAASGNRVAVGQPNANGGVGQVVVYRRDGDVLIEEQVIPVPSGFFAAGFGGAVDLANDLLIVSAMGTDPGAKQAKGAPLQALLLERAGQSWQMKHTFAATGGGGTADRFGAAVALDGDMVLIGAPGDAEGDEGMGSGALYVFDVDSGLRMGKQKPLFAGPGGGFGTSIGANNGNIAVGAPQSAIQGALGGLVELFAAVGNNLDSLNMVQADGQTDGDQFGAAVALSGDTLVVGAPGSDGAQDNAGAAIVFSFGGASQVQALTPSTSEAQGGYGSAVGVDDGVIAVGAPGLASGSGGVFRFDSSFTQTLFIPASAGDVEFGATVSVSGQTVAIGAPGSASQAGTARVQTNTSVLFQADFEAE